MKKLLLLLLLNVSLCCAQEYFPSNTGVKTTTDEIVALTNATLYISPTKTIKNGTLLIQNKKIIGSGKNVTIPKNAKIINLKGKSIYPSFIDVYSSFGIQKTKRNSTGRRGRIPVYDATRKGYYWNDHIRPETDAFSLFNFNKKEAKELVNLGFGVVNTHSNDGIMQGNGMLVSLNDNSSNAHRILDKNSGNYLSFSKSSKSDQAYPTSRMGAMALLRQTYMDAEWYEKGNAKNTDLSLEALNENKGLSQIFNAGGYLDALRADKIGDQFNIQYTILGSGNEFERIDEIKATNAKFIIPINFRKAYDVSNQFWAEKISLRDMRKWNQEPANPALLAKKEVPFALTTYQLKNKKDFTKNLQKAITFGLSTTDALAALTTIPANILGRTDIGNLNTGSYANFLITSGEIFDKNTVIYENWILGSKHSIKSISNKNIFNNYVVTANGKKYEVSFSEKGKKVNADVKLGDKKLKSNFSFSDNWIQLTINDENDFVQLLGKVGDVNAFNGTGKNSAGKSITWSAVKKTDTSLNKKSKKKITTPPKVQAVSFPNVGFGNYVKPKQETILIKNATIWTGENDKVFENSDILLKDGKIHKIGKNLKSGGAKIIDGTNKFVTAGIIDEHAHIATSAVNEAGHNSTAEVTIEDVINPDDINIYRNLAGGVTSIQILHGSANPIGGRSAIIKLKWGENADNLLYKNSPKFIKFALGENVKQSNWGDRNVIRFPQTRMGVEQVYIDYFQRAKEYDTKKKNGEPYRKDIELETLAEIINKERFISCHSYIQSEINMLMKVAEQFNFNINTFTHILEGYKVADIMKKHGAGGSTFSDWWAYKFEVNDAIPYNAAIMHKQGVIVAINSDDAEMSRRLNQEAAKTMKYGGLSAQEAWRMVTINPAKLLHLDDRTGSLKEGKDADVVLWSGNPLSVYTKAEKTIVDGTIYFDLEKDVEKREAIKVEKNKLIKMMLEEKLGGAETQKPSKTEHQLFHCDTE